ncbi:MAG: hypothetical protein J7K75_00705 [Desulfuromonas sp.]|nr:hypothetical protein [Desulfuromonas sp.]
MINQVTSSPLESFKAEAHKLLEAAVQQRQQEQNVTTGTVQDKVTLGNQPPEDVTYTKAVSDADLGTTFTMLRDLFAATLQEQGVAVKIATGNEEINLETLTPEQATELIADDGYFGVDQTSQRIFDFAVSIAGNDPSRLDAILSGIEDGFSQAEEAWGGTLPEISYQTKDAVMEKLDNWVAGFDA